MKLLRDLTPFHWTVLPQPSYCWGMEFFHTPARRCYRMRQLQSGAVDDLLRIECICEVHLLKKAHYMRRHAPFLSIEYVKQGSLLVRQRGKGYELEQGELFLMQPELENEFLSGDSGCQKISVMVKGKILSPFLEESGLNVVDVLTSIDSRHIEQVFQEVSELADEAPNINSTRNSQLTFELLQLLRIPSSDLKIPDELTALCKELEQHLEHNWMQQEMAKRCSCSCTHLVRLFRRYLNTTPHQYLLDLRMRYAQRLLADRKFSIKEIADLAGYDDSMNFSTGFRKQFGISPRDYRKQLSLFS